MARGGSRAAAAVLDPTLVAILLVEVSVGLTDFYKTYQSLDCKSIKANNHITAWKVSK